MRLVPEVPNISPRCVQTGGITVGGEYIPERTVIGASIYTLMRNGDYFQKPDDYWPERWFVNPEAGIDSEALARAQKVVCPFGVGPRSCVGWKLAWLKLNVMLARTLFIYDIWLPPEADCCEMGTTGEICDYSIKGWAIAFGEGL
ncbi:hypothetical protein N7516_006345 [Penicillium verrucosum]|uniref:uncharacterized protein n=1 Tax=Penicillium verrucosum TaxID=60171 RepID=UPI0025450703|nr:uncharacterized protein N7516_006345 [Penicillium verrucosum]KAJ5931856.1 hypothetical protein N7516_006345 [Penicillium verrucosum]